MSQPTATHINSRITEAAAYKQSICILLEWSKEEYTTYQYETGLAYLRHYLPNDAEGARMLEGSKIFWNWFKNHWANRDNGFIRSCIDYDDCVDNYRLLYEELNDARTLACAIYPSGVVMKESARAIIRDLFTIKNIVL